MTPQNQTNPSTSARPLTDREARVLAFYRRTGSPLPSVRVAEALEMPTSDAADAVRKLATKQLLRRVPSAGRWPRYEVTA